VTLDSGTVVTFAEACLSANDFSLHPGRPLDFSLQADASTPLESGRGDSFWCRWTAASALVTRVTGVPPQLAARSFDAAPGGESR